MCETCFSNGQFTDAHGDGASAANGASAGHAAGGYRGASADQFSGAVEDVETRYETRHHASCVSDVFFLLRRFVEMSTRETFFMLTLFVARFLFYDRRRSRGSPDGSHGLNARSVYG